MRFLDRVWPRTKKRLENMHDYGLRMSKAGRGVVFLLATEVIEKVRPQGTSQFLEGTRYFPVRARAALMCTNSFLWDRPDVAGWYSY